MTAGERQVLLAHVSPLRFVEGGPPSYVSTFNAALRDARVVSGRDVDSGIFLGAKPTSLWAGTLVYLVLLEQIGNTLRPAFGRDAQRESAAERALRQFAPNTTPRQREVVYALRNAFAHEFGLYNDGRKDGRYRFALTLDDVQHSPLVRWPRRCWDGNVNHVSRDTQTRVSLPALGDACETVAARIRAHAAAGSLRARVSFDELQRRFAFGVMRMDE
jgi:hypothetical protein